METINEEMIRYCAFNRLYGYKPIKALSIIENIGSSGFSQLLKKEDLSLAERELKHLLSKNISFISIKDERYPKLLKECSDPPLGIYVKGRGNPFENKKLIGIVGTRNVTSYGREWCKKLVKALSIVDKQITIVSGLAYGVDYIAHTSALESNISTIGVMATGIDDVYPRCHCGLASDIAHTEDCCLLTDYPPNTPPLPINFIRRNRIVAGLCSNIILIESREKGGGMITAKIAFSYDRDIYALPGRVDDIYSSGCNRLIQNKIAEPILSVEDLLLRLGYSLPKMTKIDELSKVIERITIPNDFVKDNVIKVLKAIMEVRDINIPDIISVTGLQYKDVSAITTILESEGIIHTDLLQRCSLNTEAL